MPAEAPQQTRNASPFSPVSSDSTAARRRVLPPSLPLQQPLLSLARAESNSLLLTTPISTDFDRRRCVRFPVLLRLVR